MAYSAKIVGSLQVAARSAQGRRPRTFTLELGAADRIARGADGTIWVAEFVGFGETGYLLRLTPE